MPHVVLKLGVCLALLSACAPGTQIAEPAAALAAEVPERPSDSTPSAIGAARVIGTITLNAEDDQIVASTVELSGNTAKASATFLAIDDAPTLFIQGFTANDTDLTGAFSVRLDAVMPSLAPGVSNSAILRTINEDGRSSDGQSQGNFTVFLTDITPTENADFSKLTGSLAGTFCINPLSSNPDCRMLTGEFDTLAQVQN